MSADMPIQTATYTTAPVYKRLSAFRQSCLFLERLHQSLFIVLQQYRIIQLHGM